MKKLFVMLGLCAMLTSCADDKTFYFKNGKEITQQQFQSYFGQDTLSFIDVKPYGWANSDVKKNDNVEYQICAGNLVWSILLCETIVAPVLFTGYALYEPVKYKK